MDNIEFISYIDNKIKQEMLLGGAKNENVLKGLRNIKSDFNYISSKDGKVDAIDILKKLYKERSENEAIYKESNRLDLWLQEHIEAQIIKNYLPKEPSIEEITEFLNSLSIKKEKSSFKKFQDACSEHFGQKVDSKIILEFIG